MTNNKTNEFILDTLSSILLINNVGKIKEHEDSVYKKQTEKTIQELTNIIVEFRQEHGYTNKEWFKIKIKNKWNAIFRRWQQN